MKMKPDTKYRVQSTLPRAEPEIPLLALIDDLDSINAELVQASKHLHRAADATFDLSRKLSAIAGGESESVNPNNHEV